MLHKCTGKLLRRQIRFAIPSAEIKERAETYVYSLSGPSCIVTEIDFTF